MNCVYVRNLRLGEGTPKVCIPLVGASDEALFCPNLKGNSHIHIFEVEIVHHADRGEGGRG